MWVCRPTTEAKRVPLTVLLPPLPSMRMFLTRPEVQYRVISSPYRVPTAVSAWEFSLACSSSQAMVTCQSWSSSVAQASSGTGLR
jgi:hypothetical protein